MPRVAPLLTASLALAALLGSAARADIDIQVTGVDEDIRRNVLVFLSLERYKTRDDLDETLIGRLAERAEREAGSALRPFGYYEPTVRTELSRTAPGEWRARIAIEPGVPVLIDDVAVEVSGPGLEHPAFRAVLDALPLRRGERLNHATYDGLKGELRRLAATLGYAEARLTANEMLVDLASHTARIRLAMETGPRYSFGATTITQRSLDEDLLRRYLRFRESDPYDATELLRTQFALDDSQYFSTVEVVAGEPDRANLLIPVDIRAEPNRRNRYSVGVGYATDSKARGTLSWENRRLNDRGHRMRAELKAAQIEQSFEARYVVPIGDPALEKFSLEARWARDDRGDLETRTLRLQPSVTHVLGDWQRVLSASLSNVETLTAATPTQPASRDSSLLVIPGISYASVPRGYLGEALFSRTFNAELRGSAAALGAPTEFLQLKVEAEKVFNLAPKWNTYLRGQLGTTWVSETTKLPGTERFFAGGDRSVRGFGYNDLSPLDDGGAKIGGRHLFTGSAELIRDLPRNLALALFVDVGNAFDDFGDPLQYSAGIGVRFRLPVVSVGIDLAQPLTNPRCRSATPDPRCRTEPGFDSLDGPRLHLNFSPKL
jgi:translocation and assembly module TamA